MGMLLHATGFSYSSLSDGTHSNYYTDHSPAAFPAEFICGATMGDIEKSAGQPDSFSVIAKEGYEDITASTSAVPSDIGEVHPTSKLALWGSRFRRWADRVGAEATGIERVPESHRTDQNPRDLFGLYMSPNISIAAVAFGTIAPGTYGLGFWDSFLCLLFFNVIGTFPVALLSTMGPKLGMRTMVIPRYSFGWWPAKLIAILNIANQIGWAMVNAVTGGQLLYSVGNGTLPQSIAVLILSLIALIVGLFGHRVVLTFERYAWMVTLVCLCIIAGLGAKHFVDVPMGAGTLEVSSILSYATAIIGFQLTWAPIAADYGVYMRETTNPWKPFWWTMSGLFCGPFFVELLGVALMTTVRSGNPAFSAAYNSAGTGGLIGQCFEGHGPGLRGFGEFIRVVLSFSVLGGVITNVYSLGLSVQVVSDTFMKVPRLIWSLLGGAIFTAAAVAGRDHVEEVMSNFLNIMAYVRLPCCF